MGLGRRQLDVHDDAAWVFNRIGETYAARPPYPAELIEAIAGLAPPLASICDVGAGIGHLALPLAARGFSVTAVEPAQAMLDGLQRRAATLGDKVHALHARAEAMPLPTASLDLVVIADTLHFLDAELAGAEIARVMAEEGVLAIITSEPGDSPFMREVMRIMLDAAPRRPRAIAATATQLAALCGVELQATFDCCDATELDAEQLARILQTISFIGPAMNPERWSTFETRIRTIPHARVWERRFHVHSGQRRARAGRTRIGAGDSNQRA